MNDSNFKPNDRNIAGKITAISIVVIIGLSVVGVVMALSAAL